MAKQTIIFSDSEGELGTVEVDEDGDYKVSAAGIRSIVDAHVASGQNPEQFLERYSDWSNGYVSSRLKPATAPLFIRSKTASAGSVVIPHDQAEIKRNLKSLAETTQWARRDYDPAHPPEVDDPEFLAEESED